MNCTICNLRNVTPPRSVCWECFSGGQLATVASSTPTPTVIVVPIRELPAEDCHVAVAFSLREENSDCPGAGTIPPAEMCPVGHTDTEIRMSPMGTKTCRHCETSKANRHRGLCWRCYDDLDIRHRYTSGSMYARRGVGNGNKARKLPGEPTTAPPGTIAKVVVLEARAAAGCDLWHPDDVTMHVKESKAIHGRKRARTRRRQADCIKRLAMILCQPSAA